MTASNATRLMDNQNYFFKEPGGSLLTFLEAVPSPYDTTWYKFVYEDETGVHVIEVDDDLNIRLEDGLLVDEPYTPIVFEFNQVKLSLLLYMEDKESFFKGQAPVFVSESKKIGLLNTSNFSYAKALLGDRLLGGVNLIVSRDENGLVSVESCVVNEGVVPDF